MKTLFYFGDVVVVQGNLIGCIVKSWGESIHRRPHYDIYVRSWNRIEEFDEDKIQRYVVSKELSEEEMEWH